MKSDEFSARPFAAGTVVGLRSFRVGPNALPGLRAITQNLRWAAGENVAKCRPSLFARDEVLDDHRVANRDCTCGFYAYFGERNDYCSVSFEHRITGIIEGYGTVTIGTLGFRASKARIIALVAPGFDISRILAEFPEVPVYTTVAEALAAHPTTKPEDVGINPDDGYPTVDFSIRSQAATQAAAERRRGLRNTGGFDKHGRRN